MNDAVRVERWQQAEAPSRQRIEDRLESEGLSFYSWSNRPDYRYSAHQHSYDKVIYVLRGSITFGLPERDRSVKLEAGDRLELASGVIHDAQVGADGVLCLEAHR